MRGSSATFSTLLTSDFSSHCSKRSNMGPVDDWPASILMIRQAVAGSGQARQPALSCFRTLLAGCRTGALRCAAFPRILTTQGMVMVLGKIAALSHGDERLSFALRSFYSSRFAAFFDLRADIITNLLFSLAGRTRKITGSK